MRVSITSVSLSSAASRLFGAAAGARDQLERVVSYVQKTLFDARPPKAVSSSEIPSILRAAMEAAAPLLQARDLQDLENRLTDVVTTLHRIDWAQELEAMPPRPQPKNILVGVAKVTKDLGTAVVALRRELARDSTDGAEIVGVSQAQSFVKLMILCFEMLICFLQVGVSVFQQSRTDEIDQADVLLGYLAASPWSLHKGEALPLEVVEAAIARWQGYAAALALLTASLRRQKLDPWLSWALVRKMEEAVIATAQFFASLGYPPNHEFKSVERVDWVGRWNEAAEHASKLDEALVARIEAGDVGISDDDDD